MNEDDIRREKERLNRSAKLNNSKSQFANKAPDVNFDEIANKTFNNAQERTETIYKLGYELLKIMCDTSIPENQDVIFKNKEKNVIAELIQLCTDINNDEFELEGMGSTALITLLIKIISKQRDSINILNYKLNSLSEQLGNLQASHDLHHAKY